MPNGIVDFYHITYQPSDDYDSSSAETERVDGQFNMAKIYGLLIFTTYNVSVRAETVEIGDPSNIVSVTTDEDSKFLYTVQKLVNDNVIWICMPLS